MSDVVLFGILWVILTILGEIGVSLWGHNMYYFMASSQAVEGNHAAIFLMIFLTPIFMFVVLMLFFVPFRFRAKDGERNVKAATFKTNRTFISIWVTVSVCVNLLFFIHPTASAAEMMFQEANPANQHNTLIVDVVARQWQWYFSYPQYGVSNTVNANGFNDLYLPVGRKVEFVLRSYDPSHTYDANLDVVHDLWIPAFGIKQDVIPGETRFMYVTPTVITSFEQNPMVRVQCAEVCGPGHPYMWAPVHVVSASNFASWIAQQKKQNG